MELNSAFEDGRLSYRKGTVLRSFLFFILFCALLTCNALDLETALRQARQDDNSSENDALYDIAVSFVAHLSNDTLDQKMGGSRVRADSSDLTAVSDKNSENLFNSYLEIHLFRSGDIILRNSDHLSPQLIFRGGIWADHDGNIISNLKLPRGFSIVTETIAQPNMFEIRCDGQLLCSGIVRGAESRKILRGSFFPDRNTGAIGVQYNETSGFWRGIGRRQDIYFEPVHYPTLKMTCQELSSEVLHKTTVFGTETESQLEEDDIGYVEHIEGFSEKFSQLIKDYSRNYFDFQPFDSTSSSSPSDSSRSRVDVSGFSSDKVETSILSPPKLERRNTFKPTSQSDSSSSSSPYYSAGSTIYVSDCASDKVIRLPKLKRRNTVTP
eukprot:956539_1